jgi:hypothetical protein
MRRSRLLAPLLCGLLAAGPSTGCTAIGAAVGAAADHDKEKVVKPIDTEALESLKDGASIEVRLRDGRSLRGRYRGLDWALTDDRIARYEVSGRALANDLGLPAPGPGARLALTRGEVASGELLGFGADFVVFREDEQRMPVRVSLDRVESLADAAGRTATGPSLGELLATAQIPVEAGLRLEQENGTTLVAHRDIAAVGQLVSPHSGRNRGVVIGAALDALVIGIMVGCNDCWGY